MFTSPDRKFNIPDFGIVGIDNAVWMFCEDLNLRDDMDIGYSATMTFRSGMGKTVCKVERVA